MSDTCPTCAEPYSRTPTGRAYECPDDFHCCRDCTWSEGMIKVSCKPCLDDGERLMEAWMGLTKLGDRSLMLWQAADIARAALKG